MLDLVFYDKLLSVLFTVSDSRSSIGRLENQVIVFIFGFHMFFPVRVFTGSDLITGSDRIGPEIGYLAHF